MSKLVFQFGLLFALTLVPVPALACGCQQINDGNPTPCVGCTYNFYYQQYCGVGCTYGYCVTTGYGACCKSHFTTLNIDTGSCEHQDCGECGQIRDHASSRQLGRSRLQDLHTPRNVTLTADKRLQPVSPDEILLVPDHCRHTYGMAYPQDQPREGFSPESPALVRDPASGGL
jgi:hypothetical protein